MKCIQPLSGNEALCILFIEIFKAEERKAIVCCLATCNLQKVKPDFLEIDTMSFEFKEIVVFKTFSAGLLLLIWEITFFWDVV